MAEQIVQMGPMLMLAGLMVGWLAEVTSRAGGYGLIGDMILGLIGSLVAGGCFWLVISSDVGMVVMFLMGGLGGVLAITVQRQFWPSARAGA